jgi:putative DNA primase/helicase
MSDLLQYAITLARDGYSVIPVKADGTKAPAVPWKPYTQTPATEQQIREWFAPGRHTGIGIITGAVSGNAELTELEGRAAGHLDELHDLAEASGLGDLWKQLIHGWFELSPGGGIHLLYRVDGTVPGNTKIARDEKGLVLAETRGEGGFVVIAPTPGTHHPTGQPWRCVTGGPATAPVLSTDERQALHVLLATLDRTPHRDEPAPTAPSGTRPADGGLSPGDDYEQRTPWADILTPHGWTHVHTTGRTSYWRRPDKTIGVSATTGHADDRDRLYVFTTSTDFDAERPYTKFGAYTVLNHGGDHTAAAKALHAQGFGRESSRPVGGDLRDLIAPTPTTAGTAALASHQAPKQEGPRLALVTERTLTCSDDANALALVEAFGDRIRYCDDRGRWLAWDGNRWHWCGRSGGIVREYAKRVARNLPEDSDKALTHKKRSLGAMGTTAMLTQAATDNRVAVALADLDAHPWELNTPAGIIDLRTGQTTPPDPDRLHTRVTAVAPDFDADTTFWTRFLDQTFDGTTPTGSELVHYLQRLVGHSAVGVVGPHVLPFAQGSGGNGKGVFLETCVRVLGDYATTAPSGFLMAKIHASHETEIARLAGARMVLCSEVNEDDRFDEAKVKQLTGGDTLTARFMQQDHFSFIPTHHLWLMGNHQPAVRAGGRSFWRRLRLIPFTREVPEDQVIDDLQGILAREHGPAVLAWIIRGAVDYAARGLREPDQVKSATADYAHEQDTVSRFLEERCRLGGGGHVQLKVALVRGAYERWCTDEGEQPVTPKAFGMQLQRHDVTAVKGSKGQRFYRGITLLADDLDDDDAPPPDEGRYR